MVDSDKRLVLVVDDDDDVRDVVTDILREEGYRTIEARTAAQAVEMAFVCRPALMLIDWVLPDGLGGAVIERLRAELGPSLPVVLLTGFPDVGDCVGHLGPTRVLTKPFHLEDLIRCVTACLKGRPRERPTLSEAGI